MTERGFERWFMRAKLPGHGYHGRIRTFKVDDVAPRISIYSQHAGTPQTEDSPAPIEHITVHRGVITLVADAIDPGVGFGQGFGITIPNRTYKPALVWTVLNENTGEETVIDTNSIAHNRIQLEQQFDFSEESGTYRITATATDCVGNTANDIIRVIVA